MPLNSNIRYFEQISKSLEFGLTLIGLGGGRIPLPPKVFF